MKKLLLFLVLTFSFLLSGCNDDEKQSSKEIEKILINQMDRYMDVLNGKNDCGELAYIMSRNSENVDVSSNDGFFASIMVKYAPNLVIEKLMNFDCSGYLDEFEGLNDISYSVDKLELDEKNNNLASLYIQMNAAENGEILSKNKIMYFERFKDDWLIYKSEYY